MKDIRHWIDRIAQRFCEWLDDFFSGRHVLATVGENMAGLGSGLLLPFDRRAAPSVVHMSGTAMHPRTGELGNWTHSEFTELQIDCNFWAYCHMKGQPCVWCGVRRNALRSGDKLHLGNPGKKGSPFCPTGKYLGGAWFGCCLNPFGEMRLIAWYDCCGGGFCAGPLNRCNNWPEAKNWCYQYFNEDRHFGNKSYYCTVAVDMDTPSACTQS